MSLPLAVQCRAIGMPEPVTEFRFHKTRRWRFDYAWPHHKLALEVDGGVWTQGRHTRGAGVEKDCEKYCEAVVQGWRILRVTTRHVRSGQALGWIERALQVR